LFVDLLVPSLTTDDPLDCESGDGGDESDRDKDESDGKPEDDSVLLAIIACNKLWCHFRAKLALKIETKEMVSKVRDLRS
jgi:hypothetical protein